MNFYIRTRTEHIYAKNIYYIVPVQKDAIEIVYMNGKMEYISDVLGYKYLYEFLTHLPLKIN